MKLNLTQDSEATKKLKIFLQDAEETRKQILTCKDERIRDTLVSHLERQPQILQSLIQASQSHSESEHILSAPAKTSPELISGLRLQFETHSTPSAPPLAPEIEQELTTQGKEYPSPYRSVAAPIQPSASDSRHPQLYSSPYSSVAAPIQPSASDSRHPQLYSSPYSSVAAPIQPSPSDSRHPQLYPSQYNPVAAPIQPSPSDSRHPQLYSSPYSSVAAPIQPSPSDSRHPQLYSSPYSSVAAPIQPSPSDSRHPQLYRSQYNPVAAPIQPSPSDSRHPQLYPSPYSSVAAPIQPSPSESDSRHPQLYPSPYNPVAVPIQPEVKYEQLGYTQQILEPGTQSFGVGIAPQIPHGFSLLPETLNIFSPEYGNYKYNLTGGIYVFIPAFCYRVGRKTSTHLYQKYGQHAVEIKKIDASSLEQDKIDAQTKLNKALKKEGWLLHRAFINNGQVQSGFFIQKYLASHRQFGQLTSLPNTLPITFNNRRPTHNDLDCVGTYIDAFKLAKSTDRRQQVTSIFQYSALSMLALVQAQSANSSQYCAWWSTDPSQCYPKGYNSKVGDERLVWTVSTRYDIKKPLTGSCTLNRYYDQHSFESHTATSYTSHNGQENGVMDLSGCFWEVASGVTTDDRLNLWILSEEQDYTALTAENAFGNAYTLQNLYKKISKPKQSDTLLDGNFPLFTDKPTLWGNLKTENDSLMWPQKTPLDKTIWKGYGHAAHISEDIKPQMIPLCGGCWDSQFIGGIYARHWSSTVNSYNGSVSMRLSTYGAPFQ